MNAILVYPLTVFWALGFLEYVFQVLIVGPTEKTLGISVAITILLLSVTSYSQRKKLSSAATAVFGEIRQAPIVFKVFLFLQLSLFIVAGIESTFPPHHPQEFDAINYHMALARQHLLAGHLKHIPWSAADLWPMPVQWGFATSWFMGSSLHKIPQFLGALGAFSMMVSLGRQLAGRNLYGWLPALAVFTSHGVMIQLGTAMLDLTNLYFLLAALHAWRTQRPMWCALHLAVFSTAKAFHPLLTVAIAGSCLTVYGALVHYRLIRATEKPKVIFKTLALSCVIALVLLMRSALVSFSVGGTPLFPFAACVIAPQASLCSLNQGQVIKNSAAMQIEASRPYGLGKGLRPFLTHLWRVAVPTNKVNNEYDYPLGLAWLLFVVFFVLSLKSWFLRRDFFNFGFLAACFWISWWFSSQQSRWLYPTLCLGWLATIPVQKRASRGVLLGCLIVSASLSLVSELRSFKNTFLVTRAVVQREQERLIVRDPQTGFVINQATLYVDQYINHHAAGDPGWILPVEVQGP